MESGCVTHKDTCTAWGVELDINFWAFYFELSLAICDVASSKSINNSVNNNFYFIVTVDLSETGNRTTFGRSDPLKEAQPQVRIQFANYKSFSSYLRYHTHPHWLIDVCRWQFLNSCEVLDSHVFLRNIFHVYIASTKNLEGWVNSGKLCKPLIASQTSITVSNSSYPLHVWMRLCKHSKSPLLRTYWSLSY